MKLKRRLERGVNGIKLRYKYMSCEVEVLDESELLIRNDRIWLPTTLWLRPKTVKLKR